MKKVLSLLTAFALALSLSTCTYTEEPPPPDYLRMMAEAAAAGDPEEGLAIETAEAAALEEAGLPERPISFDQLYLLSQFIFLRAGTPRLSQELRLCTGELILNRMASPEFPSTMRGVLLQMGGDAALLARPGYAETVPSQDCVSAAMRLLLGDRMMEPSVVYQVYERKGDIFATFADKLLGFTYFCRSEHPELYESGAASPLSQTGGDGPDAVAG